MEMEVVFFGTPAELRRWLEAHHASARELWVGFWKKGAGRAGITYQQALDEALCFGWIDGIRKGVDAHSYANRFTPRKARSIWSAVNLKRAAELVEQERMHPAGRQAYEGRDRERTNLYSHEREIATLEGAYAEQFRANAAAWAYWQAQSASYRHTATWYVLSAKREETRQRRLATLIADSAAGRRIAQFTAPARRPPRED